MSHLVVSSSRFSIHRSAHLIRVLIFIFNHKQQDAKQRRATTKNKKIKAVQPSMLALLGSMYYFFIYIFFSHFFPAFGQAVDTGVVPFPPRFLPSTCIAHRVQQSHCSSIFYRVLLTHALALSASQFVHEKKSQRMYTSMHSAGLELTKLAYTRLEDNLIRHRGDRLNITL